MTTNDTTPVIPTSWDKEIKSLQHSSHLTTFEQTRLSGLSILARGYRRAKEEDAPLLDALRRIASGEIGHDDGVGADLAQAYHAQRIARAALAKAEGRTP